jgi:hypothetical protein
MAICLGRWFKNASEATSVASSTTSDFNIYQNSASDMGNLDLRSVSGIVNVSIFDIQG